MDLFLIELLVSRFASIDVLQLETYGILVLGCLTCRYLLLVSACAEPWGVCFLSCCLIPKDLGFAPCTFSPPGLSSASDRGRRRLWELVGLSSVTLSGSAAARFAQTGPGSLTPWKVTSWLIITSYLPVTQLRKFWHFYGPSSSNF